VITVNGGDGKKTDYAIMKQVQQAKLSRPQDAIVLLGSATDFSRIRPTDPLYILSHGQPDTGDLREGVTTAKLVEWLTHPATGLPSTYKGEITICSCYAGQKYDSQGKTSLAERVARDLNGRVAKGTVVLGANGYSFGTPEFSRTGTSSVLSEDLSSFYFLKDADSMRDEWLKHMPTHKQGVLATLGTIRVTQTIRDNIKTALEAKSSLGKTVEGIATELVAPFAAEAPKIQRTMEETIKRIPGDTIADRIDFMIQKTNDPEVMKWNDAIARQYALFQDYYIWSPVSKRFTTATV
jgi:hypothetical protein